MGKTLESTRVAYSLQLLSYWFSKGPIYWMFGIGSSASFHPNIVGIYCHVVIVEVLCELGLLGLGLYAGFLGFIVRDSLSIDAHLPVFGGGTRHCRDDRGDLPV